MIERSNLVTMVFSRLLIQFFKIVIQPIPNPSDVILKLGRKRPKFVSPIGEIRSKPISNEILR